MENNLEKDISKRIENPNFEIESDLEVNREGVESSQEIFGEKERVLRDKIEKERAIADLHAKDQTSVKQNVNQAKTLDSSGKLKYLMDLASEKGVFYAVEIAKKLNDPYVLDVFHDNLASNEQYKNFFDK